MRSSAFLALAFLFAGSSSASEPKRVVTLAPSLAELAADVLGEHLDRIVGVSEYTDYPPKLKALPSIGPYHRFNVEQVAALKPDLVLATTDGNPEDRVTQLRELGLKVVVVNTGDFGAVERSIGEVAAALGYEAEGKRLQGVFKKGLEAIQARAKKRCGPAAAKGQPKVLLQLDREPVVAAGAGTFLDGALEAVGARNALADLKTRYPRPAIEEILKRDPDVILVLSTGGGEESFKKMLADWSRFKNLTAVRENRVKIVRSDALVRPSMRLLEGLALLENTVFVKREACYE